MQRCLPSASLPTLVRGCLLVGASGGPVFMRVPMVGGELCASPQGKISNSCLVRVGVSEGKCFSVRPKSALSFDTCVAKCGGKRPTLIVGKRRRGLGQVRTIAS